MSWLIPKREGRPAFWRDIGLAGAVSGAILLSYYVATVSWSAPFPRDLHDYTLGRDFLNFWIYGREAWTTAASRFYDIDLYNDHLRALIGWDYAIQQWSYPPHILFFAAPLGLMPYGLALAVWTILGVLTFFAVAIDRDDGWREMSALLLSPAAVFCLISGQNALLTAAILIAVFRWMDARPVLIGVLIGILTVKPQLGLLLPVMLALTGRWRVFFAAATTTIVLVGTTVLVYGIDIWIDYLGPGIRNQETVLLRPSWITEALIPTVFMNARIAGLSIDEAYAVQAIAGASMLAAAVWVFARPRDPLLSYCFLLVATFVLTPYLMSYDLLIAGWVALVLYKAGPVSLSLRISAAGLYWLPIIALAMAVNGIPGSALIPTAMAIGLLQAMTRAASMDRSALVPRGYP